MGQDLSQFLVFSAGVIVGGSGINNRVDSDRSFRPVSDDDAEPGSSSPVVYSVGSSGSDSLSTDAIPDDGDSVSSSDSVQDMMFDSDGLEGYGGDGNSRFDDDIELRNGDGPVHDLRQLVGISVGFDVDAAFGENDDDADSDLTPTCFRER